MKMPAPQSMLIHLPHPALRQPSQRVGHIDHQIRQLAQTMIEQATQWEKQSQHQEMTVGLAAIQINQPLRIIIVREDFQSKSAPIFKTFINPKITKYSGSKTIQPEGCLSVKHYYTNVERYDELKVQTEDLDGYVIRFKAQGFLARVLQHEIDHLKGIMTVDKAVEDTNEQGQKFTFCRLNNETKFEIVQKEDLGVNILKHG